MPAAPPLDVVPLALGAAVSPMLLVGQMRTLTAPGSGVRQSWAYLAGNALVVDIAEVARTADKAGLFVVGVVAAQS